MASLLDLNPELRGQIAQATGGANPRKRAKVYYTAGVESKLTGERQEDTFEKEAKRLLPLLERKYGKGNVDLIPVAHGDSAAVVQELKKDPNADTFIFDHAGGRMLGIPMSTSDVYKDSDYEFTQSLRDNAAKIIDNLSTVNLEIPRDERESDRKYNEYTIFQKYLDNKYSPEKVDQLLQQDTPEAREVLRNEFIQMNKDNAFPEQTGPFIPKDVAEKMMTYPGDHNVSDQYRPLLGYSSEPIGRQEAIDKVKNVFQQYLLTMDDANRQEFKKTQTPWDKSFPKDYKGNCYFGACHFADRAEKFAKATGIPTYATLKDKWIGGNPAGGARTEQEFLKNLFYNTDLAKFENDKQTVLQQMKQEPKMRPTIQVTPITNEVMREIPQEGYYEDRGTPEEMRQLAELQTQSINTDDPQIRDARRASMQAIYDQIRARANQQNR